MLRLMRKGQSTAEYAIVIGLVIAAAVAMQIYVKRGIQGKIKDAVDHTDASDTITGTTGQYEPYYQETTDMISKRDVGEKAEVKEGGATSKEIVGEDISTRTGTQKALGTEGAD